MNITILTIGIIFILFGTLYLYFQNLVLKFYEVIKKFVINEKNVILYGKKIGFIFFLSGCVFVIIAIIRYYTNQNLYYIAYKKFYQGDLKTAESLCIQILSKEPKNVEVLTLLGKVYLASKRTELAKRVFLKVKQLNPEKEFKYLKIEKNDKN